MRAKPLRPRRKPRFRCTGVKTNHDRHRWLPRQGDEAVIAYRSPAHGSGLRRERWDVGASFASLHNHGACSSAPTAATTSTKASSRSPDGSSAGGDSRARLLCREEGYGRHVLIIDK
jgi:transposase